MLNPLENLESIFFGRQFKIFKILCPSIVQLLYLLNENEEAAMLKKTFFILRSILILTRKINLTLSDNPTILIYLKLILAELS